jgi:hypothetical protein
MGRDVYAVQCTGSATTTLKSCLLMGVTVNKVLTGTVAIKEQGTAVGTIAASTAAGDYHNVPGGTRYGALTIVLSAADDVTAFIAVV